MSTTRPTLNGQRATGTHTRFSRNGGTNSATALQPVSPETRRDLQTDSQETGKSPRRALKNDPQFSALASLLVAALLVFVFGMGYLSANAQETIERNRKVKLQMLVKQELEKHQRLQNLKTERYNLTYISQKAEGLGMVNEGKRAPLILGQIPTNLHAIPAITPASIAGQSPAPTLPSNSQNKGQNNGNSQKDTTDTPQDKPDSLTVENNTQTP